MIGLWFAVGRWLMEVFGLRQTDPTPTPPSPTPSTPPKDPWLAWGQEARQKELPNMQAAAKAWADGLATFSTLVAVVGVTLAPASLKDQVIVWEGREVSIREPGLALLIYVLYFSVRATLAARAAAVGAPVPVLLNPRTLEAQWFRSIDDINRHLQESRRWVGYLVPGLVAYAVLLLFAQSAAAPKTPYTRMMTDHGVYCGLLVSDPTTRTLTIQPLLAVKDAKDPKPGPAITAPTDVTELEAVASCPPLPEATP